MGTYAIAIAPILPPQDKERERERRHNFHGHTQKVVTPTPTPTPTPLAGWEAAAAAGDITSTQPRETGHTYTHARTHTRVAGNDEVGAEQGRGRRPRHGTPTGCSVHVDARGGARDGPGGAARAVARGGILARLEGDHVGDAHAAARERGGTGGRDRGRQREGRRLQRPGGRGDAHRQLRK